MKIAESVNGGGLVIQLCPTLMTPWTVAHLIPLSMGFPRQEHWSGLLFPLPGGDLPNPGTKPGSLAFQEDFFTNRDMKEVNSTESVNRT